MLEETSRHVQISMNVQMLMEDVSSTRFVKTYQVHSVVGHVYLVLREIRTLAV